MGRIAVAIFVVFMLSATAALGAAVDDIKAAYKAAGAGKRAEAAALYTKAIASGELKRDQLVDAFYRRGLMYSGEGQTDAAIGDFDAVVRLDDSHALAYRGLGRSYFMRGQSDLALASLDKAVAIKPDYAISRITRGYIYLALARFDDAVKELEKAAALKTRNTFLPIIAHVAYRRGGGSETTAIATAAQRYKATTWTGQVMRLWTGEATPEQLLARAERGSDGLKCDANFYVGQYRLVAGDRGAAKARFETAAKVCPSFFTEGGVARAELARMALDGGWSGK